MGERKLRMKAAAVFVCLLFWTAAAALPSTDQLLTALEDDLSTLERLSQAGKGQGFEEDDAVKTKRRCDWPDGIVTPTQKRDACEQLLTIKSTLLVKMAMNKKVISPPTDLVESGGKMISNHVYTLKKQHAVTAETKEYVSMRQSLGEVTGHLELCCVGILPADRRTIPLSNGSSGGHRGGGEDDPSDDFDT